MIASTPTPPRRFRFGLRAMFVLVVVAAIPCAWVGFSLNWIRERQEFTSVFVDPDDPFQRPGAPFGLWLFGEPGFDSIEVPSDQVERVQRLFPEATIKDSITKLNDPWE